MKDVHRIIKLLAYALAAAIIVGIISGVISLISGGVIVEHVFSGSKTNTEKIFSGNEESILYIEIAASKVTVHQGDILSGVTDNEYISVETRGNKLVAIEKNHPSVKNNDTYLDITIPKDMIFEKIVIKTGAGLVEAEVLNTEDLELSIGAGRVSVDKLSVLDEADIESGAGELIVNDGTIYNLDAEMGVGKASIRAQFIGESDIESGIGELELILLGGKESYKIKADVGIGEFRFDGDVIVKDKTVGNGSNIMNVESGIGSVKISFE